MMRPSAWLRWIPLLGVLVLASHPARAQTNFAIVVPDGAWTWFNDPRALFHHEQLYIGYVRAGDGKTALSVFEPVTGETTDLWVSGFTQLDDHNNPGLLVKSDGRMLAAYARHNSDQYFAYRTSHSPNPVTSAGWNAEQSISNSGAGMTYANPFQLAAEDGKIYNFCRNLNFNPTIYTSTNGGTNWSSPQLFIQAGSGGSVRPYVKYSSNRTNRIDFLYTDGHPRNVANSLYHIYYQNGAFYQTDGTLVKQYAGLPILHDSGERGSVIYQFNNSAQTDPDQWIPTGPAWCWEIANQADGAPVAVFTVRRANVTGIGWNHNRIYYYYARWTGTNWQKRFIAHAGRPLYSAEGDYAGGICLDPQEPDVIYISSNAQNPFNLGDTTNVPLRANERYELWRGVTDDGGLTFAWTQVTTNSPVDNLRPYVPRRYGGEPSVLWFRGTYTTYTSYACSIVGLFTTAVPPSSAASGLWNSDSDGVWSDAGKWLDGIVAHGVGQTADFSVLNITAHRTVNLDSDRTVGTLRFGDQAGGQNWFVVTTNDSVLTLSGATSIQVNQNTATLAVPVAGANGFTKRGAGTLVLGASNALAGTSYLDSGSTSAHDGAVRVAHPAALSAVDSPIIFRNNTGASATGTLQLDGGAGAIVIAQNFITSCRNNNTTPTFHNLAGTNTLSGTNFVQAGGTNVIYQADTGSRLDLSGPVQYIGTFSTPRTYTFTGGGDVVVTAPILSATNAAILVRKSGAGTLWLNATNTYTGDTMVGGGTLAGTGVIRGPVTVQSGGALAPGASFGALIVSNNVTLQAGSTTRLAIGNSPLTNSQLLVTGTLNRGGTLVVTNRGGPLAPGDAFPLFQTVSSSGAFAVLSLPPLNTGLAWDTSGLANGVIAVVASNPPVITTHELDNGTGFVVTGTGSASQGYTMQAATNLAPPVTWRPAVSTTADVNGHFQLTDPQTTNHAQQFYRVTAP